ncbi:MAG: type II toxin-antitoxin system RelE/ParE family toxin [Verrucomicrobiota bacterium]
MKARFTSPAELELKEAIEFYESAQTGLGARFLAAVEAAVKLIEAYPLAWTPMSRRTRRCRIKRFPFGLCYQVRTDELLIVSVMDLRRDPKRWEQFL